MERTLRNPTGNGMRKYESEPVACYDDAECITLTRGGSKVDDLFSIRDTYFKNNIDNTS